MVASLVSAMQNTSLQLTSTDMTYNHTPSAASDLPTDVQYKSFPKGCIKIRFSQLEFVPGDNPDTIVPREVLAYVMKYRIPVLIILFVIGVPASVINMAVFFRQGLKDRVNLCLFSLALSDGLFLVFLAMQEADQIFLDHIDIATGANVGFMLKFMINNHITCLLAFSFMSFLLSTIIACERCFCVLRPLKYQTLMRTRTMAVIIVSMCVIVFGFYFIVVMRYNCVCAYDPDLDIVIDLMTHSEFYTRHKDLIDFMDNIVIGLGLTFLVTIVAVTATVITTFRLRQAVAWRAETLSSLSPREMALTKMLIGTSVLLIICISPGALFRVACLFLPEMNTGRRNHNLFLTCILISVLFYAINSSLNIFVYYRMGSRYRETFWTLFRRKRQRQVRNKTNDQVVFKRKGHQNTSEK